MRKARKKQAEDFIRLLDQAHDEIRRSISGGDLMTAMDLLGQCQEGAVSLGDLIESTEGDDCPVIPLLEDYCELAYQIHQELAGGQNDGGGRVYKRLRRALIRIENSVRNDIRVRYEMAFLPYKASMWDSLESVWQAADADPDCDAYVVPIPYYDRKPDGSFGTYHYEGNLFPDGVPVVHYGAYDLEERRPDAIYIHNPYDDQNYVTSVDPAFYSGRLRSLTECLVYIPYYSTAGDMSEAQANCPVYWNADYIVIQAERYKRFFDPGIPDGKFLALGSPKFDSIIHKCQNPPEPPEEWAEKMSGRKVYFYNTSLGGMLGNTEAFLKKMRYVFDIFKGREDSCLLWRPHPLLESTFESMRKEYLPWFERLKREFIEEGIGIYDDTPDMEKTIALSDVYIGDAATSVTSLFGVAGKPLFILNNYIDALPGEDDWRGERVSIAIDGLTGDGRYLVTATNQLWFSENDDYHYRFLMDLGTGYARGGYYMRAQVIGDKVYIIPRNALHMLIIEDGKVRKIPFEDKGPRRTSCFLSHTYIGKYIFIFPYRYPYLIRFNIETEEVRYTEGIGQFHVREVNGEWRNGGIALYGNELVFASPVDNQFLFLDKDTLEARMLECGSSCICGTQGISMETLDSDELWLMPLNGMVLRRWNPRTEEVVEYSDLPQGFRSIRWPYETECQERPFASMDFFKEGERETILLTPCWGNMFLSFDRESGKMTEWEPPMPFCNRGKNCYFLTDSMGGFVITRAQLGDSDCHMWYAPERRFYGVNIMTKEYREIETDFDYDDLLEHEPGFMEESEWLQYCLTENALNSLKDLLDGHVTGRQFSRERQLEAFAKVNADTDGTCGVNVHTMVKRRVS